MGVKPGYKQTECGVLPEDWDVVLLDSVAKRGSGHTPDKAHPEYWGGTVKWVSLQDSDRLDRLYIWDTAAKITPAGIANSSAKMHTRGTVVLSRDAGVGKSAIMKDDMAVSQHFMAWTCGPSLSNHFLYYWLQSNKVEFERIAMGSTIKTIGLPYFQRLLMPLPTRAEQDAIAEAMSHADALSEALEQLLTKKRRIRLGVAHDLLTGRKRLPGFTGDWEAKRIGQIATPRSDRNSSGAPLTVLACSKHVGFVDSLGYFKNRVFSTDTQGYKVIRRGEIGYPSNHVEEGSIGLQDLYDVALVSPIYVVFSVAEGVDSYFLHRLLKLESYRQVFAAATSSSVDRRGSLRWPAFSAITVILPPVEEQAAIARTLREMDEEIAALEAKLAKARNIRQGMMQKLLTGRIRLV